MTQLSLFHAKLLKAGAPEIKHLRSRFPLEKLLNLKLVKGIFKEIALVYFHFLLRKKLLRLPAGISFDPAIEINFHGCFTSVFSIITAFFTRYRELCLFEQCRPDYRIENRGMESKVSATDNCQPVRNARYFTL